MRILSDSEYVIDAFRKNFGRYADTPLVIYGIGQGTRHILDNFPGHAIVGLMDGARTGESAYGLPILSFGQVVELGVKLIVIVAVSSNVNLIYRRIAGPAKEHSVEVFDINGNRPGAEINPARCLEKYKGVNEAALKEEIGRADAVSFDIFDTLIMRRCLYPQDVFLMMGEDFAKKRIRAETELYADGLHPNIHDIYERMSGDFSPKAEIELETKLLTARDAVADMLRYAVQAGKKVFLTSDMYLPKEIIARILEGLNIHVALENILVSCDWGASKAGGLFETLRLKAGEGRILHVGDNFAADNAAARQYGIHPFQLERASVMLEEGCGARTLNYDSALPSRQVIGEFAARRLNDPFLFSRTGGKFEIDGNYELAYSFIAPLVVRVFSYIAERARTLGLELVLLASRDGYIMERLYHLFKDELDLPPMRYFYVSRMASVLAALRDDGDILHAARLFYVGTPEEMLLDRFRLPESAIKRRESGENDEGYILRHREAILQVAEGERKKYLRYLNTLGIKAGARVGYFDFVASGTCQKALTNIVDFHLTGLYVAQRGYEADYKSDTEIEAMYGGVSMYGKTFNIVNKYFFMENVLSSYEPSLSGFDDSGAPMFLPEHRTEADFAALREIHRAILDYAGNMRATDWAAVDIALADGLLGYMDDQYTNIKTRYFIDGELRDEFCRLTISLGAR